MEKKSLICRDSSLKYVETKSERLSEERRNKFKTRIIKNNKSFEDKNGGIDPLLN